MFQSKNKNRIFIFLDTILDYKSCDTMTFFFWAQCWKKEIKCVSSLNGIFHNFHSHGFLTSLIAIINPLEKHLILFYQKFIKLFTDFNLFFSYFSYLHWLQEPIRKCMKLCHFYFRHGHRLLKNTKFPHTPGTGMKVM